MITLKDVYEKPLAEILKEMNMVNIEIHNDSSGEIHSIEVKYAPQNKQEFPDDPDERRGRF